MGQPITAKEFLENTFNLDFLTHSESETIITAMQLFAKGKCKEQREICSKQVSGWPVQIKVESEIEEDILNSPEPIF